MIVVVDWTDWLKDLRVHRAPDAAAGAAYVEALPRDRGAYVLDTEHPLVFESHMRGLGNLRLAELLSGLTGTEVARFKTVDAGVIRVVNQLTAAGREAPSVPEPKWKEPNMPREAKVGPFKPVGRDTVVGKIYALILGGTDDLKDIAEHLNLTPERIRSALASGRAGNGIAFSIGAETGTVAIEVPEGAELFRAAAEPRARKSARVPFVGKGAPVRAGSAKAKVLEAALAGGTLAEVAAAAELDGAKARSVLAALRKEHGVTHELGETGVLAVTLPKGFDEQSIFKQKAERSTRDSSVPPQALTKYGRAKDLNEAAARGEDPPKPVIASQANAKVVQKHFDKAEELAAHGQWDALEKLQIGGSNSYMKMARAYRDRLLIAHRVREAQRTAAE